MSRNAVTDAYLEAARDVPWDSVRRSALAAADLSGSIFRNRCLTRPAFLSAAERDQLESDLAHLHDALTALPARLFGGDLGAFARAAGMTEAQTTAVVRGQGAAPTRLTRADMYHDGTSFRLMELNIGSTVGGMDNGLLNRAVLHDPFLAGFAAAHGLSHVDTMGELADMLKTEYKTDDGHPPLFAAVDWPESFPSIEALLQTSADALAGYGVEILPCHLGQLDLSGGKVRLRGRVIDVVYRVFMVEDLLDPAAPALIDPLLRMVERGEVAMFAPMDAELYGSKAALAMLSDEANRDRFSPAELASLDRVLPWTRMVRDEPVTVPGSTADLLAYAGGRREELVLKPTMLHGGLGVVLGWQTSPADWAAALRAAVDGPYVLQARIRAEPELFPAEAGLEQQIVNWGVFTVSRGFGGAIVRASTDLSGSVLNSAGGAVLGCCFDQQ